MKFKNIITLIYFCCFSQAGFTQDTTQQKTLIQFDKDKIIHFGKFGKDSLTVILQVRNKKLLFPLSYFIKGRIVGEKSIEISVPDSLQRLYDSWTISEYIATADNSNTYFEAKKYAAFLYTPFDYNFKTTPPGASIYIVPVSDWEKLFHRVDINFEFKSTDLPLLAEFKILVPSPCVYTIFEQRYIAVFVLNDKIKMEIIKPKRNDHSHNIADIQF